MYQAHSETSRNAYRTLEGSREAREKIFKLIQDRGLAGISAPNIAAALDMVPGTVAARVIELERDGRILKLERTEKSPSRKSANVIIAQVYKLSALAAGEKILETKPEGKTVAALDAEAKAILEEVENLIALGAPILYSSPLHRRIKALLKN